METIRIVVLSGCESTIQFFKCAEGGGSRRHARQQDIGNSSAYTCSENPADKLFNLVFQVSLTTLLVLALLTAGPGRAAASYVFILSPTNGATVSGIATIDTSESSNVSWINVYVDGDWVASNPSTASPPYSVTWNSTIVADGQHAVSVTGYDNNNAAIATGSIAVTVENHPSTITPTPHPTPTSVSSCITITAPATGAMVSGSSIVISTKDTCSGVWFESLYVDGSHIDDFQTGAVVFDSTMFSNGTHTVEVTSQSINPGSVVLGSASEPLKVANGLATPTSSASASPTPAPTPTASHKPTATPTPLPSCITITAPAAGATVSGLSIVISTKDTCSRVWFESLYVDGSHIDDFQTGAVVFDSTMFSNGTHTVEVTSQSINPGSVVLGSASEPLKVTNGMATPTSSEATPSPTATPKPTATATAVGHLSNVGPQTSAGPIQSDAICATFANQANFPETTPKNVNDGTGWNVNNQLWTTPWYFYSNAGRSGFAPNADFQAVDGNYGGTTQDIIRWAACKWGVDEDWAYAESQEENGGWYSDCAQLHGGSGCDEGGDCGNSDSDSGGESANLSATLNGQNFPVTNSSGQFIGLSGLNGTNHNGSTCGSNWMSWSIIQTKVGNYEWYTWPMNGISTAWGEDYRWAKWRACVNGDLAGFFGNPSDYSAAVNAAKSNPNGSSSGANTKYSSNETNMQYLALGCVGAHFSGAWYSNTDSYLANFINILSAKAWPGGRD